MSLESQIADLNKNTTDLINYFNAKKAGIESALAAAIAAAPETSRSWFVDQVAGSDTNSGSRELPFKSFEKAIASTPASGLCTINLLGDYTMTALVRATCAYVYISGVEVAVRPKITVKYVPGSGGATELAGFLFRAQAANIEFRTVEIALPSISGIAPAPVDQRLCSFLRTNQGSNLPPMLGVSLESTVITMDASFFGALIGNSTCAVCLNANATTFPSGFGGKYISSVGAGIDPKSLNNVLTNLPSL